VNTAETEEKRPRQKVVVAKTPTNKALASIRRGHLHQATHDLAGISEGELRNSLDSLMQQEYRVEAVLLALCAGHVEYAKRMIVVMGADGNRAANTDQFYEILELWTKSYPNGPTTELIYKEVVEQIVDPGVPLRKAVVAILRGDARAAIHETRCWEVGKIEEAISYLIENDLIAVAALMVLASGNDALKRKYLQSEKLARSIQSLHGPWTALVVHSPRKR